MTKDEYELRLGFTEAELVFKYLINKPYGEVFKLIELLRAGIINKEGVTDGKNTHICEDTDSGDSGQPA